MSYDKNNIKNTTEDGIADLVRDIISIPFSLDYVFTQIKFKPYRIKIKKALLARDEEDWSIAHLEDSIDSYKEYLSHYSRETPYYTGIHIVEAEEAIRKLKEAEQPIEPEVPIEPEEPIIPVEPKATNTQIAEIIHLISVSAHRKELDKEDNTDWLKATSENAVSSYLRYIQKHLDNPYGHVGKHVDEANCKILSLQDDADWQLAVKINTQKGYNKYIEKYESLKSEYQGKYLDKAKSWIPGRPNPKSRYIILGVLTLIIGGITFERILTKEPERKPLTDDEIDTALVQYVDSLKQDLFDGFYLIPISKADIKSNEISTTQIRGESENDSVDNGLYYRDDVISKYMMNNGKFIVKNIKGETIDLPEAENGIDSICIKKSPFFEYIDNNGLRRVVALYDNDIYFYIGECGTIDNIRQCILVNKEGKYGIINLKDGKTCIVKNFINDKIEQISSSKRYYVLNDGVKTEYQNGHEYIPTTSSTPVTSSTSTSATSSSNKLSYFYDSSKRAYGYKDSQGNVVIKPQYLYAWNFDGEYAKVKGQNGYGIINRSNVICVPLQYKRLDLSGTTAIAQNTNGQYGLISVLGKVLVPFAYIFMDEYGNYIKVKNPNGKSGLFDANGKRILNDIYDDISLYSINNGLIPCQINGYWGYMSTMGSKAIDFKYRSAGKFYSYGLAAVMDSTTNSYGYINKSGNYVIKPSFYSAGSINEDGAQIGNSDGLKARIDKDGNILTQYYKEIGSQFYCDRIWVVNDSLIGFSDNNKHLIIPFMFDYPAKNRLKPSYDSYSHLCKVSYNGVEWYINTNGAFAYPAKGNPTEQKISQQIQEAKAEAERQLKEKRARVNKKKHSLR